MIEWLTGKSRPELIVDVHSHLLPGLDDGVKTLDESIKSIKAMSHLGYKKLITTPHIYPDFYPNSAKNIGFTLEEVKSELLKTGIDVSIEAAAEYFLDPEFLSAIKNGEPILSFGKARYVLFETGFQSKPVILEETIFELKAQGYNPILAHPERYEYLDPKSDLSNRLIELGVMNQISLPSLKGFYGSEPKKKAMALLKQGNVDFLGSDLHRFGQIEGLKKALQVAIPKAQLLNNSLI